MPGFADYLKEQARQRSNARHEVQALLAHCHPAAPPVELPVAKGDGKERLGRCRLCRGRRGQPKLLHFTRAGRWDASGQKVPSYVTEKLCDDPFHRTEAT